MTTMATKRSQSINRQAVRAHFRRQLVRLQEIECWIVPQGRLITRDVNAHRRFTVHPVATWVGRYAYPFDADQFLGDLDAALAKFAASRRPTSPA